MEISKLSEEAEILQTQQTQLQTVERQYDSTSFGAESMNNEEAMNALKSELSVIKRKIQNNEQEMSARTSRIRELENQ